MTDKTNSIMCPQCKIIPIDKNDEICNFCHHEETEDESK